MENRLAILLAVLMPFVRVINGNEIDTVTNIVRNAVNAWMNIRPASKTVANHPPSVVINIP